MIRSAIQSVRKFSARPPYEVNKGQVKSVSGSRILVNVESSGEEVWARMHPRGKSSVVDLGATVFVARPFASDSSVKDYELIAFGTRNADGKTAFTKFSCVHPERPLSTPEKLCSNCPRRASSS